VTAAAVTVPATDIPGILWKAGQAAVAWEDCSRCHARPGKPCTTAGHTDLVRFIAAFMAGRPEDHPGHVSYDDIAVVISWAAVHCGDGILIPTLGGES
jgi:hypothetical protein